MPVRSHATSGERQIELVWRCSSCKHQSLGRYAVCQGCGNPKDDSEEYEMPVDPAAVASVTDPALLRMATAGENWSCAYCGSDQRALDGSCAQCGAGKGEGANANAHANANADAHPKAERFRKALLYGTVGFVVLVVLVTLGGWIASRPLQTSPAFVVDPPPPVMPSVVPTIALRTEFDATVTEVSWKRVVTVETFQLVAKEDFAADVPAGAVDVRAAGQHHHHDEQVFDHNDIESYEVEVPDGTRSESYTERVSCGQDCTTTSRTCKRVCSGSPRRCSQKTSQHLRPTSADELQLLPRDSKHRVRVENGRVERIADGG